MDIEIMSRQLSQLFALKPEIENLIAKAKAAGVPSISPDDIQKITTFIPEFEQAIEHARAAIADVAQLAGDVEQIRKDLAPVIEWVQAKQKAEADAAATADAEARELAQQQADEAAKPPATDKPADQPAA